MAEGANITVNMNRLGNPTVVTRTVVDAALGALVRSEPMARNTISGARQAAVLVPLVDGVDGVCVRFIVRPAHMKHHPDQPAFPGGTVDPGDGNDHFATALRETHEELAISATHITRVASLTPLPTGTGFVIEPYVGWVDPDAEMVPSPDEVAAVFDAPLALLLDSTMVRTMRGQFHGVSYPIRFYLGHPRVIWGATAHILAGLLRCIEQHIQRQPSVSPLET